VRLRLQLFKNCGSSSDHFTHIFEKNSTIFIFIKAFVKVNGNEIVIFKVNFKFPQHGTAWHSMALHGTAWHSMAQYGTTWHYMALHGTAWHCMAQHGTAWHCMA
jgi:hypothetical protein